MPLPALKEILEEYQLVDAEDRYRLLIDLGRQLEPMPDALKTDATKVRGRAAIRRGGLVSVCVEWICVGSGRCERIPVGPDAGLPFEASLPVARPIFGDPPVHLRLIVPAELLHRRRESRGTIENKHEPAG